MTKCQAYTKEGKRCKNFVGKGKKLYCSRHSGGSKATYKSKKNTSGTKYTYTHKYPSNFTKKQHGG